MNKRQLQRYIDNLKRKLRFRGGLNFRRKRHRFRGEKVQYYSILVAEVIAVILAAFLITKGYGIRVTCAGESMEPTIAEGSATWVNRVVYKFRSPQKGDVIAFLPKGNQNASYSTKRVVATPGDTVLISNGKLYINGKVTELKNKEIKEIIEPGRADMEVTLGEEEYFVLGDNINNSEDSRYESVGNVKKSDIYGKVWFNLSFKDFGSVE